MQRTAVAIIGVADLIGLVAKVPGAHPVIHVRTNAIVTTVITAQVAAA